MDTNLDLHDSFMAHADPESFWIFPRGYLYGLGDATEALYLMLFKNKYRTLFKAKQIKAFDWFFYTVEDLGAEFSHSWKVQNRVIASLEAKGILKSKRRGVPPKRYFQLNIEKIREMERLSKPIPIPPSRENSKPSAREDSKPSARENIIKRNTPKRNTPPGIDKSIPYADDAHPSDSEESSLEVKEEEGSPQSKPEAPEPSKSNKLIPDGAQPRVPQRILKQILLMSPVFSKMKLEGKPSKTLLRTEKILNQIRGGTFLTQYKWKKGWMTNKLEGFKRFPNTRAEGDLRWVEVIGVIQQAVNAWTVAMDGGLEWPKVKPNGSRERISLDSFLLNQAPTGTTSPFLGFVVGAGSNRPAMRAEKLREGLPKRVGAIGQLILETRLDDSGRAWGEVGMSKWWTGISDLMSWRSLNHPALLECDVEGGNARHLAGPVEFMRLIQIFLSGSDPMIGSVMYPQWDFIGPDKEGWKAFVRWAKTNFKVTLELSGHNRKVTASRRFSENTGENERSTVRAQVITEQEALGNSLGKDFSEEDLEAVVQQRMEDKGC